MKYAFPITCVCVVALFFAAIFFLRSDRSNSKTHETVVIRDSINYANFKDFPRANFEKCGVRVEEPKNPTGEGAACLYLDSGEIFDTAAYFTKINSHALILKVKEKCGEKIVAICAAKHVTQVNEMLAMVIVESSVDPKAKNKKGGKGYMGLEPPTMQECGVDSSFIFNPDSNIVAGVEYFSRLMRGVDNKIAHALTAYNCGPGNYLQHLERGFNPERNIYAIKVAALAKKIAGN
jgi:hypothetical protein